MKPFPPATSRTGKGGAQRATGTRSSSPDSTNPVLAAPSHPCGSPKRQRTERAGIDHAAVDAPATGFPDSPLGHGRAFPSLAADDFSGIGETLMNQLDGHRALAHG